MLSMMLNVENISADYGKRRVINKLSFSANEGQLVVIVGRNGCGKTTLLKSIIGDVPITDGIINFCNDKREDNLVLMTRRKRAQYISMVEQQLPQATMLVEDYIALGRLPYQSLFSVKKSWKDIEKVQQVIDKVGINYFANREMQKLSGGEKQLCAIARMLVQDTPIILLDEPISSLDILHQITIVSVIKQLRDEGKIVICVIHDLNIAFALADVIGVMKAGAFLAFGKPTDNAVREALDSAMDTEMNFFSINNGQNTIIAPRKWNEIF